MKEPFDIDVAIARVRQAVRDFPPAALFALADEGHRSLFEQVVACILSIRTYDEVTLPTARRLFAAAPTPAAVADLPIGDLEELIRTVSFAEPKARQIHAIARATVEEHGGTLPCDRELLLGFNGVGPKCAHLALGIACGEPWISVDVHVHRVTNRWGYVQTRTPAQTTAALEAQLPERYWVEINRLLVPFGKHVCTGDRPHCSTCPVLPMCRQVGVTSHR
ncbi:endonuclease III domain-containing protein [Sphaerobacter thermophilus]|jgi:endonuclease-3|uniref:endonuclease III domain-containing protein n=1 Tax=Sphaerobacter thermophilus TaxID=2057 RepID=UPI000DB527C2|nr:MAG: DNA lyase [Sphaerobacter thermophilus]